MSLFGAMNTAISGLGAQSSAFSNISDNVANSQTTGFKRVDTNFIDYLTTSNASTNWPGAVVARPDYRNSVQGNVSQSDKPLALAIAGQGFFAVSQQAGVVDNQPTFKAQQFYTRAGDFQMDQNGYIVNSAGGYLNGWPVTNGVVDQNTLQPIQVSQTIFNPIATDNVNISANLPATPAPGTASPAVLYTAADPEVISGTANAGDVKTPAAPISSVINVYDALGTVHSVTLKWIKDPTTANKWTVQIDVPTDKSGTADRGTADVTFGATANSAGTIQDVTVDATDPGTITTTSSQVAGNSAATLSFVCDFGSGNQTIQVNLGSYGKADGVTQYAGTDYNLRGLTQDGVPPGAFSSVSTQVNGDVSVNYDNGQSRVIYRVPVVTFNNPNALQRQDGQAFTVSQDSGPPLAETASTNGAGNLVTESVEGSNVDIATEFSKLIVAQRAYTANTKLVTSADELLQQTIDMKR